MWRCSQSREMHAKGYRVKGLRRSIISICEPYCFRTPRQHFELKAQFIKKGRSMPGRCCRNTGPQSTTLSFEEGFFLGEALTSKALPPDNTQIAPSTSATSLSTCGRRPADLLASPGSRNGQATHLGRLVAGLLSYRALCFQL